ncbi:hypothetical protein [Erwinia rhapontici]|uniref:hypothetical protein n=1 Tax=Erwinia rhapontici TaxID=55212 RepID=UPI0013311AFB|nr:hypothetical protein [Erwinia rhapontici]MBP2157111.1 putative low-complexity protein [Erwinia rhapontici]
MPAGTIALTNNSAAVTGTGTSFGTELAANDFIVATVGGVTYTLGIESVDSATALTLSKIYDGPTTATAAWTPLPAAAMSLISAQTAADVARALRAANFDKVNWQQVFSELGDITVTLPDGSQFQGPSWRKISELLATLDVGSITEIAAQIHADAEQVASDKSLILQAADNAIAANNSAQQAKEGAQAADQSAQQSKADATTQAGIAKAEADRAKAEADRAAASNPDNSLLKSQNLNDLPDKSESRKNLDVYSRAEVDGKGGGYVGRAFWHPLRTSVPGGNSPGDGQMVNRTGTYASVWAECAAGRLPVVTDAVWLSDPTKRGCYSSGDGSTTFRFPDYNGVQPGSIPAPVMRGDGGLTDGTIQQNAAPNITGFYRSYAGIVDTAENNNPASNLGAFALARGIATESPGYRYAAFGTANSTTQYAHQVGIDASRSNTAYGRDGALEVRGNSIVGCWVIQFAGVANNAGSIDALALSTRIEQVAQSVSALSNRIGYALVNTTTNLALNSRMVLTNPFGNTVPVIVVPEIYHATLQKWITTDWVFVGTSDSRGVRAHYSEGEGIVLRSGSTNFILTTAQSGVSQEIAAAYNTPSPIRVHVWKVQS